MSETHPADQTAVELVAAIEAGQLSSREALEAHLERVEVRNGPINAVVALDAEGARARADEADAAQARGERRGVLHGLPMTIKDSYEVVGMPTTSGAPEHADHHASTNAVAVQRLMDAGAVVFGKTNLPLYAGDVQSYNEVYGTTSNPFDVDKTCGGSSGGAAAALAAGMTPLELGSDIGGSIRNPAHFCGVYGHKPSHGLIPTRGHIPGPPGTLAEPDLSVAGPLARSVSDLEVALDVMMGPEDWDAPGWRIDLPQAHQESLSDFRVGVWLDDPHCPVSAEVGDCLQAAVDAVAKAGTKVDTSARPQFEVDRSSEIYWLLLQSIMGAGVPPAVYEALQQGAGQLDPKDHGMNASIARGMVLSHRDWLRAHEARMHLRSSWRDFFGEYDVMLCPIMPTVAFPHDHRNFAERTIAIDGVEHAYFSQIFWAGLIGVSLLPSTVIPVGPGVSGLPVGIQVVTNYLDDRKALRFAELMDAVTGGFTPPSF